MSRWFGVAYGVTSYIIFLGAFLYAIGFTGNLLVPKGIDSGATSSMLEAVIIDLILLALFAVQHSVMARPGFKSWWTKFVPRHLERSTYVLLSSLLLLLLFWQWRPILTPVWVIDNPVGSGVVHALFWLGWAVVLLATFLINHFDLFGLRQVWLELRGNAYTDVGFKTPLLYGIVRHPIMLGFIIAFWAAPTMTAGHLLFAVTTTLYILIALPFEEQDLIRAHGDAYRLYRQRVPMLMPLPRKGANSGGGT